MSDARADFEAASIALVQSDHRRATEDGLFQCLDCGAERPTRSSLWNHKRSTGHRSSRSYDP